jgi:aminomethyltransferase
MVPFAGFEMPVQYAGVISEHMAVRESVGVFDVSHMGEVRVRGPKAAAAINWLVSNDVSAIAVGSAAYAAMCNHEGGIVDDLFVYRLDADDFLIVVNAANRAKDFAWMMANNPHPDAAEFVDVGDEWSLLAVQGRAAEATLQKLADIQLEGLPGRSVRRCVVAGVSGCILARTGYTGEDGFELFAPAADSPPLWDGVLEAGQKFGIVPCGLGSRDTLRLEVRNPLYGHELTDETSPLQAGLGFVTKLDVPFLGRDAILARKGKATHRISGLVMTGKRIARDGMKVYRDGVEIGWVTSGTRAPCLGKGVALAYLAPPNGRPGTEVTIDVRGREATAVVHKGAFYKHSY